MAARAVKQ